MQQLPLTAQSDSGASSWRTLRLPRDARARVGGSSRCASGSAWRWRFHLAKARPVYQASARLLVLQQGGSRSTSPARPPSRQPLPVHADGYSNSLSTHIMIIRSPLIVEHAIAAAGVKGLSAGSVIAGLSVKLPDPTAKVIELGYKAGLGDEAVRVVDSVIKSYD